MRRSAIAVGLLLLCSTLPAQNAALPPLTARVDVKVINVDATVLDRQGRPVTQLTKDDFEIFEDGQPQKVTNLYVVDRAIVRDGVSAAPEAAAAAAPQRRFRRKAILLVDNHFVDKRSRDIALEALRKFIAADYTGEYEWSIAVIGKGVHVLLPFTSEKAIINESIDRVMRGAAIPSAVAIDGRALSDRSMRPQSISDSNSAGENVFFNQRTAALVDADKAIRVTNTLAAMRGSARAVIDACRAYTSLEGKKLILLITGGMEVDNRQMDIPTWRKSTGTASENDRSAGEIREAMVREANAANVSLYILNASGTVNPVTGFESGQGRYTEDASDDVRNLDSFAVGISAQTGGMYLTKNRVAESIKTVDDVSATFYSLGYAPTHYEDRKYHSIQVRVKGRPEYRVLHRSGYLDLSSRDRLEDSIKVAMNATVREGTLPLQVDLGKPVGGDRRVVSVPVTAVVPIRLLTTIKQGDVNTGRVHVYISLFDREGANVGFHHMVQQIDLSDDQLQRLAAMPESKFRYPMNVKVKRGAYSVIVALVDELSEELGKTSAWLDTDG